MLEDIEDTVEQLTERRHAQEQYSSKDSIIIINPSFEFTDIVSLLDNLLSFLDNYLKFAGISESNLKTYPIQHVLLKPGLPQRLKERKSAKFVFFCYKEFFHWSIVFQSVLKGRNAH